jgi:hypothetical protein
MSTSTPEEFAARLRASIRLDELHLEVSGEHVLTVSKRAQRRRALTTSVLVLCAVLVAGLAGPALVHGMRRVADVPPATRPLVPPEATAAASATPGIDALTDDAATQEYRAATAAIEQPLPEGVDYPASLPAGFVPADGYLEAGAGRNQANVTWLCAWEGAYLSAEDADDAPGLTRAATMLESWATSDFYTHVMVDPERGWVTNVLVPMRRGDSTGIRTEHTQMCSQFPTVRDPAAGVCADPAVAARVDEGLASTTEGPHNSILVSPDEMREMGETEESIARQLAAWRGLSPADIAFQQCLRARQGQPILDPVPGVEE